MVKKKQYGENLLFISSNIAESSKGRGALVNNRERDNLNQSCYRVRGHGRNLGRGSNNFNMYQIVLEKVNQRDLPLTIVNMEETYTSHILYR